LELSFPLEVRRSSRISDINGQAGESIHKSSFSALIFSLLGFLALALSVVPVILLVSSIQIGRGTSADDQIKGEYLRAKSPFMASSSFEPGGDDSPPKRQESGREEA